jgi:hypothetical protein
MKSRLTISLSSAFAIFALSSCSQLSSAKIISQTHQVNTIHSKASWISSAQTIKELASEADAIVKVRITSTKSRTLEQTLPTFAEDGKTVIGELKDVMPFTDSDAVVSEVFKGSITGTITILQTGGLFVDGAKINPDEQFLVIDEDPIFGVGSDQILFLKDISKDPIHSKGRPLFVIINPNGRFEVKADGDLINFSDDKNESRPTKVDSLGEQLQEFKVQNVTTTK